MAWTADDLLADVRRSGMLPSATTPGCADTDVLLQADKEMQTRLMPLVISVREEFAVVVAPMPITVGTAAYRIPKRNLGGRVRDVLWLPQGYVLNGDVRSLPRIEPERVWQYAANLAQGEPVGFYLEGANVVLVPAPSAAGGVLLLKFFARPGRLVNANNLFARQISTVSPSTPAPGTTRITLAGAHSFNVGVALDVVRGTTPFDVTAFEVVPNSVSSPTLDIPTSSLPADFSTANNANDWVTLADTSPVVQLPIELHGVLAQRTVARMLQALGYLEEAAQADKDAMVQQREALKLLTPRVEGEPRKVVGQMFWRRRGLFGWGR